MKNFLALLLIISCFACSNQILPITQETDDLGVMLVTDDSPKFTTIDIDERVFSKVNIFSTTNEGCVSETSGPYNRVQSDNDLTKNVNAISASLFLPSNPASEERSSSDNAQSRYTPNIYTGGKTKDGAPIDVGFYSDRNGLWIPFINAKPNGIPIYTNLPKEVINGKTYVYRIKPGTNVSIKVWVSANDTISFSITGDWVRAEVGVSGTPVSVGVSTRVFSNPNATGWKTSGENIAWKFMTSVAIQPADAGDLTTGDYSFNGSSWSSIKLGMADAAGKFLSSKPFTSILQFQSGTPCVKPSDVVNASVNLPNISVNIKLRVKGQYARTPKDTLELSGYLGDTIKSKINVANTFSKTDSLVTLNFTPPLGAVLTAKQVIGGKNLDIPFSYKCDSVGNFNKQFRAIYSENETATATDPGDPASPAGSIKYVAGKDIVKVLLKCLKDLDYTAPTYNGLSAALVGTSNAGTITFTNKAKKVTYTVTSSDPTLFKITTSSGSAITGAIATIATTLICPANAVTKEVTVTIKITNGTSSKTETLKIPITCKAVAKPKASIAPNPINITAPVGSTASGSFTLENTGEVDSTLDYIVYRPGQTASTQIVASIPVITRALPPGSGFPSPIGSVDARFTSPSETTGSLLKISATTVASTTIPVSATCSTVGSFSSVIEVTYATGDLTATGTPVFASSDITVNVTCTSNLKPKISALSGPTTAVRLLFDTSGSVNITFSNVGNAPLEYSSMVASGMLAPNESVTVQVSVYCGWIPGDQKTSFYVNSNDPDLPQQSTIVTVHCYGEITTHDILITSVSKQMSYSRDVTGLLDTTGCYISINSDLALNFPAIVYHLGFPRVISNSFKSLNISNSNYPSLVTDKSYHEVINSSLSSTLYGTGDSKNIYSEIIASNYGVDTKCERPPLPLDLFNAEVAKVSSEIDGALALWQSSVINDSNQITKLTNIRRKISEGGCFYGCAGYVYNVLGDVVFSFN